MRKEILLNDQGLKIYCIIDGDSVSFEFDKNISFLSSQITLSENNGIKTLYIGKKRILRINGNEVFLLSKITTTEIRILRALYNNSLHFPKYSGLITHLKIIKSNIENATKNLRSINHVKWDEKQHLKTELHTHLLEILNAEEFVNFVNQFNISFPLDINGNIDFESGVEHKYSDILKYDLLDKLYESLTLNPSKETNFDILEDIVKNRSELIKRCANNLYTELSIRPGWLEREKSLKYETSSIEEEIRKEKSLPKSKWNKEKLEKLNNELSEKKNYNENLALAETYNLLLDESLKKLSKEKIEYSEISFSSPNTLRVLSKKHRNDSNFKLLMSVNRENNVKHFKKVSKNLEELLYEGSVIGLDIMGYERPIDDEEYEVFKDRYEWILPVLHMYPNSVLRIHAGEFVDATENVYKTLKAIKETSEKINEGCINLFKEEWGTVPPPRIRIGHGINIEKNPELIKLLKELDVIVEFNISSNYALGHIKDLNDFPLKFYEDNGIKYVFSTDGGGVYSTSLLQEENLANNLTYKYVGGGNKPIKEGNYIASASRTESKVIETNKTVIKPSVKDKNIYDKYRMYLESKPVIAKTYTSFLSALEDENKVFSYLGDTVTEISKIQAELKRLERYIEESDISLYNDYVKERIYQIKTLLSSNTKTDEAKIYLFLLEKEKFPELDSSFKTLEYVYNPLTNTNEKIASLLRDLIGIVKNIYESEDMGSAYKRR